MLLPSLERVLCNDANPEITFTNNFSMELHYVFSMVEYEVGICWYALDGKIIMFDTK